MPMHLSIHHETRYRYETPARYSIQYLRLVPRIDAGQRIIQWRIDTPGRRWRQTDAFGNTVMVVSLNEPHDGIRVQASGMVESNLPVGMPFLDDSGLSTAVFLVHTRLTQPDETVREIVASVWSRPGGTIDRLQALMSLILERVQYLPGVTDVTDSAAQALAKGAGVCQDHAHIFLACCREAGIPARYVSGYLNTDDTNHIASHAWADAWVEGSGWLSFDATHERYADERYCRLAVGRDYLDASPVRGMRSGGSDEKLSVRVLVTQATPFQQ